MNARAAVGGRRALEEHQRLAVRGGLLDAAEEPLPLPDGEQLALQRVGATVGPRRASRRLTPGRQRVGHVAVTGPVRAPKSTVPSRTIVAPSSTATP